MVPSSCAVLASFNPRAREGRDPKPLPTKPPNSLFQSTRPRGARLGRVERVISGAEVSIHAPARGATRNSFLTTGCASCFNPRAREGRDLLTLCPLCLSSKFQSTRPRGARPAPDLSGIVCISFNPRAREGRDLANAAIGGQVRQVSIHAPARGATSMSWR